MASLEDAGEALTRVSQWLRIDEDPGVPVRVAVSVTEIRTAKAAADTAVVLHFQGTEPLAQAPKWWALSPGSASASSSRPITTGARPGDGCCEPDDGGLSRFGRSLVGAMNRHRIAVDIAHAGVRTSLDAIACSTRPVIASHANARAVCEHPRNLPDEVIKAVAASGGVIGLCAFPSFVSAGPAPALDQLIDHAVHIAGLVGAGHVGLGLDFAERGRKSTTSTATTRGTTLGRRGCGRAASNGSTSAAASPWHCRREGSPRLRPPG